MKTQARLWFPGPRLTAQRFRPRVLTLIPFTIQFRERVDIMRRRVGIGHREVLSGLHANHTRRKRLQVRETEYSIINDSSFRYGLLTYYMSKDAQIRQLLAAGFDEVVPVAEDWPDLIG